MKNDHGSNNQISTIKFKLHELELQILEQKLDITQKISKLKEAEQTCSCAGWCAINHQKHSWSKSSSKELSFKLQKLSNESVPDEMQTCNICEETFTNVSHLQTHMEMHEQEFQSINSFVRECNTCKECFSNPDDFILHMENNHKKAAVMFLD